MRHQTARVHSPPACVNQLASIDLPIPLRYSGQCCIVWCFSSAYAQLCIRRVESREWSRRVTRTRLSAYQTVQLGQSERRPVACVQCPGQRAQEPRSSANGSVHTHTHTSDHQHSPTPYKPSDPQSHPKQPPSNETGVANAPRNPKLATCGPIVYIEVMLALSSTSALSGRICVPRGWFRFSRFSEDELCRCCHAVCTCRL